MAEEGITYKAFMLHTSVDGDVWVPLPDVKAATQGMAMNAALAAAREAHGDPDGPESQTFTVATVAERNWSQGTAVAEVKLVTSWRA